MNDDLIQLIRQSNPWLATPSKAIINTKSFIQRIQAKKLLLPEWDNLWLILTGPRQAGKTTLGLYLSQQLIMSKRFTQLLYLNCDILEIRRWLTSPLFIEEAIKQFELSKPIIYLDEVQRLENPGLLLKAIADLKLPIKMIATGSSQLEIRSKVQEFLTGRHLESIILPLSYEEMKQNDHDPVIYGCYPSITKTREKQILLKQLYDDYINKDIIEILKVGKPDIMQQLITLTAHSSGQLINFSQLATDCKLSSKTIQNYLGILEKTFVIKHIRPFVGNKRKEVTSNPILYFIDNGFRNQALRNFSPLIQRQDASLLIEGTIFQEILKYKHQHFLDFDIHYWRTQSGAEIDFILYKNEDNLIPVEVKFRNMNSPTVTRAFRSFIDAYKPKKGIFITKDFNAEVKINNCNVHFISFANLVYALKIIEKQLS